MKKKRIPKPIVSYAHPPQLSTQEPDPRPGNYYVSVKDGARVSFLAGPYPRHQQALDLVEAVRAKANDINSWAAFYSFGTLRTKDDYSTPGLFNQKFPDEFPAAHLNDDKVAA